MTTRQPSPVQVFSDDTLEQIAYSSVTTVPVREPNDQARLGYHLWQFLTGKIPSLEEAIHSAHSRLLISESETGELITQKLRARGIQK